MNHLTTMLQGLGNGGVFAALALALVLTYRSSGVINFATGSIALYAAYTYAGLRQGDLLVLIPGLPVSIDIGEELGFVPAAIATLLVTALFGAFLYVAVFRPLRAAPPLARAVASLAVLVVVQELMAIRVGVRPARVEGIFPNERWVIGEVILLTDRLALAVSVVLMAVLVMLFYRYTRFGLVTRAAADSETGALVSGISPDRIALLNWMISAMVAGAGGILIAPVSPLTPVTYTLFVVPALAAALVGGFSRLMVTVIAGLVIGMLQTQATSMSSLYSWMPQAGAAELVSLIVVMVALLLTGSAIPQRGGLVRESLGAAPRPRGLIVPACLGLAIGLAALLVTDGPARAAVIGTFIAGIIALSLVVVTGYAGQVSVAQLALAGAGAFTLSFLTQSWGVPFPIAPLMAAGFSALIGVMVSLPALRLRGLTLGIVTLAFAYTIEGLWFRNGQLVDAAGATVEQPRMFGIDLSVGTGLDFPRIEFGLVCLVVFVAAGIGVGWLRRSALGSAMLAVRANERSAAGLGANVTRVKVTSFAISAFIAGLGGALVAYRFGTVTFASFTTLGNLTLLSSVYLAGVTSIYGSVLAGVIGAGGVAFYVTEQIVDGGRWFHVVTSVLLIVTLQRQPEGLAGTGHALGRWVLRRLPRGRRSTDERPQLAHADRTGAGAATRALDRGLTLQVRDLGVRYGAVAAVSGVDIDVPPGAITGLIGPNGAGKTSVIDAITGFTASSGDVHVGGDSLTGLAPHRRVGRGLARTFQAIELYDELTVGENVSVAARGSHPQRTESVRSALALLGIESLRDRVAGELSQGERQLVSIARACAAVPAVLLLDEPAAGLDTSETRWLGERIRSIADAGTGVLLVDHDVSLVLALCDQVYVLDFGKIIAYGIPSEIRADPLVAQAYLGGGLVPEQQPTDGTSGAT